MKKFLLLGLLAGLTACSGGTAAGSVSGSDLVGTWENGRFLYEFTEDGDLYRSINLEGYEDDKEDIGDYKFSGANLIVDRDDTGETEYNYTSDESEAEKYVNYYYLKGDTLWLGATRYTKVSE